MTTRLLAQRHAITTPIAAYLGVLQAYFDGLLVRSEGMPGEEKKSGLPVLVIVLIVAGVALCLLPICVIAILTLLGPAIGNVFSQTIMDI